MTPNTPNKKEKDSKVSDTLITPSPYLCDTYTCSVCNKNEATLYCSYCKQFFCAFCANVKPVKGLFYCPKCGGRLYSAYETHKRFIGSKRAQQKMKGAGKRQRTYKQKGKIIDKGRQIAW